MVRNASAAALTRVPPWVWLIAIIILTPGMVAAAVYRGMLGPVALGAVGAAGLVIGISRPRLLLLAYVALIPLENALVIAEASTLTRIVGVLFFGGYVLRRFGRIELRVMPLAGWLFVGWACLSLLWAINAGVTVGQLGTLIQLFVMTIVVADYVALEPTEARRILWVYSISAVVTAIIGIAAFAAGSSFLLFGRAGAFEEQDPAQFAAILVPAFFFVTFEMRHRRYVGWMSAALVILAGAILLSGTRSAWLAVGTAFVVGVIPRWGGRAMLPMVLVGVATLAVLQIPEIGAYVAGRADSALTTGGAGRIDIWSVGLAVFADHPIFGVGFANFPVAFTPEIIRDVSVPGLDPGILIPGLAPHSSVIGTLTELGVVGAALLAGFLLTTLVRPGTPIGGEAVKVALFALLTQSLLLDVFNRKQLWLMMALALGLAWHVVAERNRMLAQKAAASRERAERLRRTWVVEP